MVFMAEDSLGPSIKKSRGQACIRVGCASAGTFMNMSSLNREDADISPRLARRRVEIADHEFEACARSLRSRTVDAREDFDVALDPYCASTEGGDTVLGRERKLTDRLIESSLAS